MDKDIKNLIKKMSLEQKASLCSGLNRWLTKPVEKHGIPSIRMNDGPIGLRFTEGDRPLEESRPAVCFPCLAAVASSWNRDLAETMGQALAREALSHGVHILLGPGVNMKRTPLCGRNFEYLSEDPHLSGEMGAAFVRGVQSRGVGTSLKHFAANNQETRRMAIDARIDERALREIYLPAFERVVKQAKPWTVMCAYNSINGDFASQNRRLLTEILRQEWGFEGVVVSDWEAVFDRVRGLVAGLELEMPGNGGVNDFRIVEAVRRGDLEQEVLDTAVERLLVLIFRAKECEEGWKRDAADFNREEQHALARKIAGECIVLLKNDGGILPLDRDRLASVAVIGQFAKDPRFQGGGSAHINPTRIDSAFDAMVELAGDKTVIKYAPGYPEGHELDQELISEAVELARGVDVAVVFAGLPETYESEGYDRTHINLPSSHNRLIEEVCKVQQDTVVVLSNGSAVAMPWVQRVRGIVEAWLLGQAGGGAIADVLFGVSDPCAKLSETFPHRLEDNPSYLNFPGDTQSVSYGEGVYIGYRYYDRKRVEVLFPFGYGLSYTRFEYTAMKLGAERIKTSDSLTVTVKVRNSGERSGKEIVQLYVRDSECTVDRPEKELKGFCKVSLEPGDEREVAFTLSERDFAYYDVARERWTVEAGEFEIFVGGSSADLPLRAVVFVESEALPEIHWTSTVGDWWDHPKARPIAEEFLRASRVLKDRGIDLDEPQMFERICRRPLVKFAYLEGLSEAEFRQMIERANSTV
jgi:beta-glucosidase